MGCAQRGACKIMAFNSKTFDLVGRWPLVEIWLKAHKALDTDPSKIFYVPVQDEGAAKSLMHTFNRVRLSLKAQKEDSDSLTHIILRVTQFVTEEDVGGGEDKKQWAVSFSDRSEPLQSFKIMDKKGHIL